MQVRATRINVTVECGVESVVCLWSVECGVQSVQCKVWSVKCTVCVCVWSVECGVWVWSVKCGVWSVKCGV